MAEQSPLTLPGTRMSQFSDMSNCRRTPTILIRPDAQRCADQAHNPTQTRKVESKLGGPPMTLDQRIAHAAARAAVAARNNDDDAWREWSDEATRLLDQRDRQNTEHAHIHSDEFTAHMSARLAASINRLEARNG